MADPTPRPAGALLEQVGTHALDEDYAVAAAQRPARGRRRPLRALALVAIGALVAVAVLQTTAGEASLRRGRADLVGQIQERRGDLAGQRSRAAALSARVATLSARSLRLASGAGRVAALESTVGAAAGADRLRGPGVRVVVDDAPGAATDQERVLDQDLQKLVNALWASGATAIAVDGIRLSNLSAIRTAGSAITVDYRSVRAPYVVVALGDPNQLLTRFVDTTHGQFWYDLASTVGIRLDLTPSEALTVPPARRLGLSYARVLPTEEVTP